MKVSKKNAVYMVGDLICFIIVFAIKATQPASFNTVFLLATTVYAYMIISWFSCCSDKLNYFTMILVLSYLYYFGQYLLNFFGVELTGQYTINNIYTPSRINSAALYLLLNMVVLHFSVILFQRVTRKEKIHVESSKDKQAFQYVSLILLGGSFVCEIAVLLFKISINRISGYSVALNTNYTGAGSFSYIVNFASTLYLPSLFAALVSTKGTRLKVIPWISYVIFVVLYFMSGSRFEAVVSMAGIFLLINFYYKKINLRKLIKFGIIGVIVLYICALMSNVRRITNYGRSGSYGSIVQEALNDTADGNFLTETISTAGFQVLTVTAVYENCPEKIDYSYGTYYLGGIIRVIPNLLGGENKLITDSIDTMFKQFLTKTYGMGSSFIIEAYYNFGNFGILMMLFYGYLISYVSEKMGNIRSKKLDDEILTYFIFYIAATSFFWIRSDARFLVREIVYYYYSFKFATWVFRGLFLRRAGVKEIEIRNEQVNSTAKI